MEAPVPGVVGVSPGALGSHLEPRAQLLAGARVSMSVSGPGVLAADRDSPVPLELLVSQSQSHPMQGDFLPSPPPLPHSQCFPPSSRADSTGPSPVTPRGPGASGTPQVLLFQALLLLPVQFMC